MAVVIVESGNEFVVEPPASGEILIDASKLRRVIENLLSNAAKFTKNGRITFSASMRGDTLTMSVEDTGAGISENSSTDCSRPSIIPKMRRQATTAMTSGSDCRWHIDTAA